MNGIIRFAEQIMGNGILHVVIRVLLSGCVFLAILLFLIPWVKDNKFINAYQKKKEEREGRATRFEGKRHVWDIMDNRLGHMLDDTYYYSRIRPKSHYLDNSLKYFISTCFVGVLFMIVMLIVTGDALGALFGFILGFGVMYGYLYLLRVKNNREVGNEIVSFLNLLGNYSTANTEIMSVFMQVAPNLNSCLSQALVECVAESQKSSDYALNNLFNKIENRKFREILKSLIVSQKYSGSFIGTVADNRNNINTYVQSQKQLKSLVVENSVSMIVCSLVLVAIVFVLGQILNKNLFIILFTTHLGLVVLFIFLAGIAYFVKKMLEVNV